MTELYLYALMGTRLPQHPQLDDATSRFWGFLVNNSIQIVGLRL